MGKNISAKTVIVAPECDSCLFGCRRGAKWTARNYMDDAVAMVARPGFRIC